MNTRARLVGVLPIILVLLAASWQCRAQQCEPSINENILSRVAAIYASKSNKELGHKPLDLMIYVSKLSDEKKANLNGLAIDALGSLILHENPTVKIYAANSLGILRGHAKSQLQKIEREVARLRNNPSDYGDAIIIETNDEDVIHELQNAMDEIKGIKADEM